MHSSKLIRVESIPVLAALLGGLSLALAGGGTAHAQCAPLTPCPGSSLPITFESYPPARTGFPALPTKNGDVIRDQYVKQGLRFATKSSAWRLEIQSPAAGTQSSTHDLAMAELGEFGSVRYNTTIQGSCPVGGSSVQGRTPSMVISFVNPVWPDLAMPRSSVSLYTGLTGSTTVDLNARLVAHRGSATDLVMTRALFGTGTSPKPGVRNLMTVTSAGKDITSVELYFEQAKCKTVIAQVPLPAIDDLSWK